MKQQLQNQCKMRSFFGNSSFCNLPFRRKGVRTGIGLFLFLFVFSFQGWSQSLSEDFEGGIPSDWGVFLSGSATQNWGTTTDGYQSESAAFLDPKSDNIGDGNLGKYFLVSPQVAVPENAQVRFMAKYDALGDANTIYKVMVSTAPQPDIEDFLNLMSWTGAELANYLEYNEGVVELPSGISPGIQVFIAFVVENTQVGDEGSGSSWALDNVRLLSGCDEMIPDDVSVVNIGVEEADITWTHPAATNFGIVVVEEGEEMDASNAVFQNSTSYHVEGLEAETTYDVYIQAICAGDIDSDWVLAATFETYKYGMSCDFPIVLDDFPYSLSTNLDQYQNPNLNYDMTGAACLPNAGNSNYLQGGKIFFSFTAPEDGIINLSQWTTPFITGTGCFGNALSAVMIFEDCSSIDVDGCLAALQTTQTGEENAKYIDNFQVLAGETYILISSTQFNLDASVCINFDFDFATCPTPTELSYDNLLQNSANFSWDNPFDLGDQWEYAVLPVDEGEPTGNGTLTSEHENVYVDGLEAGETYNFYVRSLCGADYSSWSLPLTFSTQCAVKDIPYFASLRTSDAVSSDVDCWDQLNNNGDQARWLFEANYVRFPLNQSSAGINDDYLVSPQVDLGTGSTKRIRFIYGAYGNSATLSVLASSSGLGAADFNQVIVEDMFFEETGWDTFAERIIVIPDDITGIVNIAFYLGTTTPGGTAFYVRDVNIEEMPACSDPLDPWVDNITGTTADVGWTPGYQETQWEIFLSSITDPAPEADDSGILVDSDEYTLEDLEPGTQYQYYVRAYCNDEDQSEWIGPVIFNTECNTVGLDIPYVESFNDSDPDTKKFCWTVINGSGAANVAFQIQPEVVRIQTPAFGFPGTFDEWLISPLLNLEEGIYNIQFDHRAMGGIFAPPVGDLQVLVSYTDMEQDSFVEIEPMFNFTNPNFETKSIYYQQETAGEVYIALRVPEESNTTNLEVDNFVVELLDFCPAPTHLTVSDVTATSAEISWNAGFAETEWEMAIEPAGSDGPVNYFTVTDNPYLAENLDPITSYEVYIRSVCDETMGESDWVGPVAFTTYCNAVYETPFLETFENTSESRDCWLVVNQNNDAEFWHLDTSMNPYEGILSAGLFTGTNGANNDWLISPTINVLENQRIRFYYSVMDEFFIEDLKVFISTTGTDVSDFTIELFDTGENTINNEEYKEMVLNIPDGITGAINIAFQVPPFPSVAPYRGQSLFIDNVIVEDIPDCPNPINLEVTNIQDQSALLSWEIIGDEDTWEVVVIPENDLADPENIDLENIDEQYIHITQSMPYLIEDLDAAQRYYIAVRAICSEDSESIWSEIIELLTVCDLDNQCEYTITLYSDNSMGVGGGIDIIQNEQVIQTLQFPTGPFVDGAPPPADFIIFVCNGVEFSLYWDSVGSAPNQYPGAWVKVTDSEGNVVFDSGPGIGVPKSVLYTGVSTCGEIDCPQPENLEVDENMLFTWEAGGDETQWEVAIKPVDNGTLPLSGTIVDVPEYTPTDDDFINLYHMTYDFYVRAVCSDDSQSYWRGPLSFARGDSPDNAVVAPVNSDELCTESVSRVSFRNTHQSSVDMTCESEEVADVWVEFTATSRVHIIEVGGFTGYFYQSSGEEPYPNITTTLYKVEADNELTEVRCSQNNVIVAAYASELEVGETYKVRITRNNPEISTRLFTVCITTPEDLCEIHTVNGDFERPELTYFSGVGSIGTQYVVPNWRKNGMTFHGNSIFIWEGLNSTGGNVNPYSGIQSIQLTADAEDGADPLDFWDEDDPRGMYTDMQTAGMTTIDYSYAQAARGDESIIQLYAGPVDGPYTLVREDVGLISAWTIRKGTYEVPEGQDETRFMFTVKYNTIGAVLDLVDFVPNNKILSEDATIDCQVESVELEANGVGEWQSDDNNPGELTFSDSESRTVSVSGFSAPGEYVVHWVTKYCDETVTITVLGVEETPEVVSPVEYCEGQEALPLTAEALEGYTLVFFADEDGEGMESLTPDTSEVGTTEYYVAYEDENGCIGPKATIEVIVNELDAPVTVFEYEAGEVCIFGEDLTPEFAGDFAEGGVFSSTPAGLNLDSVTGVIDPANSEAGVYEITYSIEADLENCMAAGSSTVTVTITESITPVVDFNYENASYCEGQENPEPQFGEGFTEGGTFTATPEGLNINAETGAIDIENSVVGVYEVTYSVEESPEDCQLAGSFTTTVEISETIDPEVYFNYGDITQYCVIAGGSRMPETAEDFTEGGTFTVSPEGLAIDSETGEIFIGDSQPGVYEITYTVEADADACQLEGSHTTTVEILEPSASVVDFDYGDVLFCAGMDQVFPEYPGDFTTGGQFTSVPEGLAIDSNTGVFDLSDSNPGVYEITYTVESNEVECLLGGNFTVVIEVAEPMISMVEFFYPNESYCGNETFAEPVLSEEFTFGGSFTSSSGIALNSETGVVDINASTPGTYEVTYTVDEDLSACQLGASYTVSILIGSEVAFGIDSYCDGGNLTLKAVFEDGEPSSASYAWTTADGQVIGNSSILNFTSTSAGDAGLPVDVALTIDVGGCEYTQIFTVTNAFCTIPEGISPNGDGYNDSFNLTGMGVKYLTLYNRYGLKVFSKANYTNEWAGQSDNGKDLPTGTYYYVIETYNGESVKGWVYLNRNY